MKLVKKLFKFLLIFLALVVVALIAIPVFFKDDIVSKVKSVANESVNAKIDFGDFSLGLLSSFPNFTFNIQDVSVINKAPFEGDTLAYIGSVDVKLDLMSVINGKYVVSSLAIDNVTANAKILKNGTANWDIAIEDSLAVPEAIEGEEASAEISSSDFITGLEQFSITNVNVSYVDLESDMVAIIKGFNQSGSLIMVNDSTEIDVKTSINAIIFDLEGERLANNLSFDSNVKLAADLNKMGFLFKENTFRLNTLNLGMNGLVEMPTDDINFDLTLLAKNNEFKDLLSIVPAAYLSDLEGVETNGNFNLVAHLKGLMTDDLLPKFDVNFDVNKAYLKYPDLPESVENINIDLKVDNKTGALNNTVIDLSLFHLEIAKNPIDFKFYATNIETDFDMKGEVKSKLQLEKLKSAIPMEEGEDYQGNVSIDLNFAGKLSDVEAEAYDKFDAKGQIIFDQLVYKTPDLPTTLIKTGYLNFSPQFLEVSNFDMMLGKSDLTANGRIDNIFSYVFHDSTIVGTFNLNSKYFDLDQLMAEDSTLTESPPSQNDEVAIAVENAKKEAVAQDSIAAEEPLEVFEIPKNVDFVLAANFKKIDMEDMPINNLAGEIILRDGIAKFNETKMEVYSGLIQLNGDYNTQNMAHPNTSLDFSIDKMEIREAYMAFNTVKKMVPLAEKAQGQFNLDFKMFTELTDSLTPLYPTMDGKGFIATTNLGFSETDAWKKLMDALKVKKDKYDKIKAEDVKIFFSFKEGKLVTQPFKLNMGKIKGEVSGWSSFEGPIEYTYALKIPREMLGSAAEIAAAFAEGLAAKYGANIKAGEFVDFNVVVTGTMDDPKYKVVPKGMSGESSVKEQAKEAVKAKIDEAKAKAKEELDKAKDKAKEEAERMKNEAKEKAAQEAERLKKEAEAKAKAEADKAKKKAEEEAKKKAGDLLKGRGLGF